MPAALVALSLLSAFAADTLFIERPARGTIITTNSFPLAAEVRAGDDSVLFVEFRSHYYIPGLANERAAYPQIIENHYLGRDSTPPFEWVWDIQAVPDHHYGEAAVYFSGQTRSGRTLTNSTNAFVIDRNPAFASRQAYCRYGRPKVKSRPDKDSGAEVFSNGDNRISFQPFWDNDSLFFWISVLDRKVICQDTASKDYWLADDIEIFIDAFNNKSPIPDSTVHQIVLTPAGAGYIHVTKQPPVAVKSMIHENGYELRVGIPWARLGIRPSAGQKIGLEMANFDLDLKKGFVALGTWTNLSRSSFHNPSEWGTLVLMKPRGRALYLVIPIILAALALWLSLVRRKKTLEPNSEEKNSVVKELIRLVDEEFRSENFNLDYAASKMGRNPNYLSSLFRMETGEKFNQYLNNKRLEEAHRLLKSTSQTISEVSYNVGYCSYEYFTTLYKKKYGKSPSENRKSK